MPAPYRVEEVTLAIVERARTEGIALARLRVYADEGSRVWVVEREVDGLPRRARFPFASPRGIYTPGEIASLVIGGRWPFE